MGWNKLETRAGWMGGPVPVHQLMYARLAPEERPDAVLAFASADGSEPWYISARSISTLDVHVDGAMFFGLGTAGMVGAGLAAAVDRFLAPWDLHFEVSTGDWLHLHAYRGPAPSATILAEVQARVETASRTAPVQYDEQDEEAGWDCHAKIVDDFEERLAATKDGRQGYPQSGSAISEVVLDGDWTRTARTMFDGEDALREVTRELFNEDNMFTFQRARDRWIGRLLAAQRCSSQPVFPGYGPSQLTHRDLPALPSQLLEAQGAAARAYAMWADAEPAPDFGDASPWVQFIAAQMLKHLAYARTEKKWERKDLHWIARSLSERAYAGSDETTMQRLAVDAAGRGRKLKPAKLPYAVDGPAMEFALAGFDPDVTFMSHQFLLATAGAVAPLGETDVLAQRAMDSALILVQLGYELGQWDAPVDGFPLGWGCRQEATQS